MIWAKGERRKILTVYPNVHNASISQFLGAKWKTMSNSDKEPYYQEQQRLAQLHMEMYPDYKYQPRQKPHSTILVCIITIFSCLISLLIVIIILQYNFPRDYCQTLKTLLFI